MSDIPEYSTHPRDILTSWVDAVYPVTLANGIPWHEDAVRIMLSAAMPHIDAYIRDAVVEDERERIAQQVRRETAERIAAALLAVDPVEWALAGQRAGHDAAEIARSAALPERRTDA